MDDLIFLQQIRAILSGPEKWTQGRMAKSADGGVAIPTTEKACCWCVMGAAAAVCPDGHTGKNGAEDNGARLARLLPGLPETDGATWYYSPWSKVIVWNDDPDTTFDMISAKLDQAIADLSTPAVA